VMQTEAKTYRSGTNLYYCRAQVDEWSPIPPPSVN